MVKLLSSAVAAAVIAQSAWAHMSVIAPPPRSGIVKDELIAPCGGGNVPTKNMTTFSVNGNSDFVLRPGHGSGNLIFSYFLDTTVTNDTKAHLLKDVPIPKPDTYTTTIDFAAAGLKAGQQIVVQAIYNGTDDGKTDKYYVCFDVKLSGASPASASHEEHESHSSSASSLATHALSLKAVLGATAGLLVAAAMF
ncbi:hypothetical protein H4R19_005182 [Coemansia spiralis]|nr:hypothetical protein H4R19_005182 [Coemansia spiralis]